MWFSFRDGSFNKNYDRKMVAKVISKYNTIACIKNNPCVMINFDKCKGTRYKVYTYILGRSYLILLSIDFPDIYQRWSSVNH